MQDCFGIDKSWFDAGLDIGLTGDVMSVIAEKRKNIEILPSQEDVLNAIKKFICQVNLRAKLI